MCAPGTIEAVSKRLAEDKARKEAATRREFLRAGAAVGALGGAGLAGTGCRVGGGVAIGVGGSSGTSSGTDASSRSPVTFSRVVDLSHVLHDEFPAWFEKGKAVGRQAPDGTEIIGPASVEIEDVFTFSNHRVNLKKISYWEHVGTHMDAPSHFSEGSGCDEVAAEDLVRPLAVIDVKAKAAEDPLARLTLEDVKAWEAEHGPLPQGACVALNSGWAKHVGTEKFFSPDANGKRRQPAFHVEAIDYFLEEREVAGIAIDTLSFDNQLSPGNDVHYRWLGSERWGVENVANLDDAPAAGATIVIGQPKIKGGTGGPNRIFALV